MGSKPLQVALAVLIIAFTIYVYNFPPNTSGTANEPTAEAPATEVPPAEQPPTEAPSKDGFVCPDYQNEDMSTLDADLIHEMTEDYRANQLKFINTNTSSKTNNDAYSIWFDLITLKKFLYHIEKITKTQDSTITNDQLGVRIYYASYPEMTKEMLKTYPDLKATAKDPNMSNYSALHTLVMIPTITTKDGSMLDFNPLDFETYGNGLAKLPKYGKNNPANIPNNTAALSGTSRNTGAKNHGMLYPPAGSLASPTSALGF